MCIAILAPIGRVVDNARLYRGWSINDDGAGFAYVDENDKIVIVKGFDKYGKFHTAYAAAAEKYSATSPFLVHMRIGSAGDRRTSINTHPFAFTPEEGPAGALIHNGTMFYPQGEIAGTPDDRKSDTRIFAEQLGPKLVYEDVKAAADLLERVVGYSRLAILYANREYVILNEERPGLWLDGVWYSNQGCALDTAERNREFYTR